MTQTKAGPGTTLAPQHRRMLKASAITPAVIKARGYFTATTKAALARLGFAPAQQLYPALVVPIYNVRGERSTYMLRPNTPRVRDGKPAKYEFMRGFTMVLDVPNVPAMRAQLDDPAVPLWITEGSKKVDCLVSHGCCGVGVIGVWNWRGTNAKGGKVALADWELIALNERMTYIVYDSDVMVKREVYGGLCRLAEFLILRHAHVRYVYLPSGASGAKVGVDDYLAAGHTIDDLVGLASADRRPHQGEARRGGEAENGLPPRFSLDDTTLWYTPPLDEDGTQPPKVQVCARLEVVAATRDEDDSNHGHLLQFLDRHGHPQEWAMPLELLEEQREYRKVLRRLGLRLRGASRHLLQEYLEQIDVPTRARCVGKAGWHGEVYVMPGVVLGDVGQERMVLQTLDVLTDGYRQKGTRESWQQEIAARCVGNSRLIFAVSAAFAAALIGPLDEESGGIHLLGQSTEGKTTAFYVAGSVWGEQGRLETWRATANGLEGVAANYNDNLLCLDELKQIDPREAGQVAYMLANGVGKRRGKEHGGTRKRLTWRLLFLSNGELSLERHIAEAKQRLQGGQEVRLPNLPANAGTGYGLFEDLHGSLSAKAFAILLKTQTALHYGHAGRAFVEKFTQERDAAIQDVRTTMAGWLETVVPAEAPGQIDRVARRFAMIGAAGELATAYGITGWETGAAAQAAQRCFNDWLHHRGGLRNTDEDRAIAQVRLFFEQYGRSRFEPWREGTDGQTCQRCHGTGQVNYTYAQGICFTCNGTKVITDDHPAIRLIQTKAGWSKATDDGGTEFYVQKQTFRQVIAEGLDVPWLSRILKVRGYLLSDSRGKSMRRERVPGLGLTDVYHITSALLGAQEPGEKEEKKEEEARIS